MSGHNINNNLSFNFAEVAGAGSILRLLEITNHSEAGLRLGGTISFLNSNPPQGIPILRVGGHGATHFANSIIGAGLLQTKNNQTTHLVPSRNNFNWQGQVGIATESLGFIKRNNALPGIGWGGNSSAIRGIVVSGGTLGFRSHGHGPSLDYSSNHKIQVTGEGAVRQWGMPAVGAVYNDGGKNTFAGDITMTGDTWFGSRGDRNGGLTLTGPITGGNYSFTKVGPGLITLTNPNNTWTGKTHLNAGVLRITDLDALPTRIIPIQGNGITTHELIFKGGILEFANTKGPHYPYHYYFLGTGAGQTSWLGSGGFSASGGPHAVQIVSQTDPYVPMLQWGQNGFVPVGKELLLSSRYADSMIVFANSIAAGGATIRVERGLNADAFAAITGALSGASKADFAKTGPGLLYLDNTTSNYVGQTQITDGALGGFIPTTSNINLSGGVVMLENDFTRSVGTAAGQIQWRGNWWDERSQQWINGGGFSAWTGDQTVQLNNSTSVINWNDFLSGTMPLKFGHYTASGTVIWDKQLGLGAAGRTIQVERGRDLSRADVVFNQAISASSPSVFRPRALTIEGDGRMDIRVNNPQFQGAILISGAELRLHSGGRLPNLVKEALPSQFSSLRTSLVINYGGTLTLDNRGTHTATSGGYYLDNRLNTPSISMANGARLQLIGRAESGLISENIDYIYSQLGAINIDLTNGSSQGHTQMAINHFHRISVENYIGEQWNGGSPLPFARSTSTLNLTSRSIYASSGANNSVSLIVKDFGKVISGYLRDQNNSIITDLEWFRTRYEINDGEQGEKIIP